jgi:DNA-binding beta-propeller fold protein YncE
MTKITNGSGKILLIMAGLLVAVLFFQLPFSEGATKFRYMASIYADDKGLGLKQPEGVACDGESLLIVADTGNGRLLKYSIQEGAIEVGTVEIKVDQLSYPIKTEINSRGEIYILDRRQRSIIRLTPAGEFRGYLQPVGLPSPSAYVPRSFTVDRNDNIYILDILSERVLILDPAGRYVRQIKFPDEYGFFSDVAMGFRGTVLLIDVVDGMVFSAGKNSASFSRLTSSLKEYVRFPANLTTDDRGRIYLADRNGGSIIILGQDGSFISRQSGMGWKEGSLNYPAQMCINNKGEIFIADTRNHRIQIFAIVE